MIFFTTQHSTIAFLFEGKSYLLLKKTISDRNFSVFSQPCSQTGFIDFLESAFNNIRIFSTRSFKFDFQTPSGKKKLSKTIHLTIHN
jgi:hypothetical protein